MTYYVLDMDIKLYSHTHTGPVLHYLKQNSRALIPN